MIAANGRPYPGGQFPYPKRFGNVVVSSSFECLHFIVFAIANGQHEDRKPREGTPHPGARLNSSGSRHVDVEKHGIVISHVQAHKCVFAVACLTDLETKNAERGSQTSPKRG